MPPKSNNRRSSFHGRKTMGCQTDLLCVLQNLSLAEEDVLLQSGYKKKWYLQALKTINYINDELNCQVQRLRVNLGRPNDKTIFKLPTLPSWEPLFENFNQNETHGAGDDDRLQILENETSESAQIGVYTEQPNPNNDAVSERTLNSRSQSPLTTENTITANGDDSVPPLWEDEQSQPFFDEVYAPDGGPDMMRAPVSKTTLHARSSCNYDSLCVAVPDNDYPQLNCAEVDTERPKSADPVSRPQTPPETDKNIFSPNPDPTRISTSAASVHDNDALKSSSAKEVVRPRRPKSAELVAKPTSNSIPQTPQVNCRNTVSSDPDSTSVVTSATSTRDNDELKSSTAEVVVCPKRPKSGAPLSKTSPNSRVQTPLVNNKKTVSSNPQSASRLISATSARDNDESESSSDKVVTDPERIKYSVTVLRRTTISTLQTPSVYDKKAISSSPDGSTSVITSAVSACDNDESKRSSTKMVPCPVRPRTAAPVSKGTCISKPQTPLVNDGKTVSSRPHSASGVTSATSIRNNDESEGSSAKVVNGPERPISAAAVLRKTTILRPRTPPVNNKKVVSFIPDCDDDESGSSPTEEFTGPERPKSAATVWKTTPLSKSQTLSVNDKNAVSSNPDSRRVKTSSATVCDDDESGSSPTEEFTGPERPKPVAIVWKTTPLSRPQTLPVNDKKAISSTPDSTRVATSPTTACDNDEIKPSSAEVFTGPQRPKSAVSVSKTTPLSRLQTATERKTVITSSNRSSNVVPSAEAFRKNDESNSTLAEVHGSSKQPKSSVLVTKTAINPKMQSFSLIGKPSLTTPMLQFTPSSGVPWGSASLSEFNAGLESPRSLRTTTTTIPVALFTRNQPLAESSTTDFTDCSDIPGNETFEVMKKKKKARLSTAVGYRTNK